MTAWIDAGRTDSHAHPWLAELVFGFDAILRQRLHVVEYSTDPSCIFRLNITRAERPFILADRTQIRCGDRIVNLHLWNEQIPPVPTTGPTLAWGRTFGGRLEFSIRELARYFARHPEMNDIAAIGANAAQGTREQRTNIMRRFGFAPLLKGESPRVEAALHRFGENILISVMVWAQNRTALLQRYGSGVGSPSVSRT
jgi:hypothetical protein